MWWAEWFGQHSYCTRDKMTEGTPQIDENYLTKCCANPNTVENICGGHKAAGCLTMGSSIQPSRGNANESKVQKDPPKRDDSYPSSLRSTSTSCTSYSLEISVSTTNTSDKESQPLPLRTSLETRNGENQEANPPSYLVSSITKSCNDHKPLQDKEDLAVLKVSKCLDKHGSSEIVTAKSPSIDSELEKTFLSSPSGDGKVGAQPVSSGHLFKAASTQEVKRNDSFSTETRAGQDGEDTFYAFVILHAQEDAKEAARLKSKFELISSTIGATFSEDFEIPGHSTFKCVEDAIENSAFVMLLLTKNFNTRLNETNADSALMNSIDKPLKYNTVIPLLPRVNGLTRDQMPYALKTIIPLDETKGKNIFEKMVQKVLNSRSIERQKSVWRQGQLVKKQQKKHQMLQEQEQYNKDLNREASRVRELEEKVQHLKMQQQHLLPPHANQPNSYQGFSGRPQFFNDLRFQNPSQMPPYYSGNMWQPQPSNIHIQNAKYIMIGDNSTMTVGGAVDSEDEDNL